jgi:hypothetical protein
MNIAELQELTKQGHQQITEYVKEKYQEQKEEIEQDLRNAALQGHSNAMIHFKLKWSDKNLDYMRCAIKDIFIKNYGFDGDDDLTVSLESWSTLDGIYSAAIVSLQW